MQGVDTLFKRWKRHQNHHPHDDESQHQKRPDPSYLPRNAQEGVETREAAYQMQDSVRALETRARPPYDKERWRQKLKHFCTASIRGLQFTSLKSLFPINPENLDLRGRPNNINRPASRYDHAPPPAPPPPLALRKI